MASEMAANCEPVRERTGRKEASTHSSQWPLGQRGHSRGGCNKMQKRMERKQHTSMWAATLGVCTAVCVHCGVCVNLWLLCVWRACTVMCV